jgi:hypothetical protein
MVDGDDVRAELLGELAVINELLADRGVPAVVSSRLAEVFPTSDLPRLVAFARKQYLGVLYQLGGTV